MLRKGRHPSRLAELVIGPAPSGRTRWLAPQGDGIRAKHDAGSCSITMIRAAERRTMDQITNQPPPLEPYNLLQTDRALCSALVRDKAGWAADELAALGKTLGEPETIRLGFAANAYPPVLRAFDRYGHRIDEVEFHPAWHALLSLAVEAGLHASPWAAPRPGAHVARAAGTFMLAQIESGVYCPIAMTYGAVPALRHAPTAAAEWLPRIISRQYDPRARPAPQKTGVLLGMAMTENQGGSDLRTNTTQAEFRGDDGTRRLFRLTGQKWFMSAPMCDAFLVLAQAKGGLSCFLVPRWTRDGEHICHQGLVDKFLLECEAMRGMMNSLRHRLADQARRADRAIEPRVIAHFDNSRNAAAFFADQFALGARELHFTGSIGTVAELVFESQKMNRVALAVAGPTRHQKAA